MGGYFRPKQPVYTALFLLLSSAFSRDGDSSCSGRQQSYTNIGSVRVDTMYVDLPPVVHVVGDTMYEDTLDPGLKSFALHCSCLSGARGFYVSRHRYSSCAVVVALLFIIGGVKPNPGPTAHGNYNRSINLGCLNVRLRSTNRRKFIRSSLTTTWTYLP